MNDDKIIELENRIAFQEKIHKNVSQDGNVYHYWNILPVLIIAVFIGYSLCYLTLNKK